MKKLCIIINPKAGTDQNKAVTALIRAILGKHYQLDFKTTAYAGHGKILAQEAVDNKYFAVVAVGGDGSVNEIAQSLVHTDTALGIIPMGSGNGLARSLKIDLNPKSALENIKNGHITAIDVGYVNNSEYFLSNIGVGFDVAVTQAFAKSNHRGFWGYFMTIAKCLWKYKPANFEISIEDAALKFSRKAFLLNVANAEQFGYNFHIAPRSSLTDGKFDLVLVKPFPKLKGLIVALKAFSGKILESTYTEKWECKNISISGKDLNSYQIDGDYKENPTPGKISISMLPKAINVFYPL